MKLIPPSLSRSLRLSVRTSGFQPEKRGSIPLGTAKDVSEFSDSRDLSLKIKISSLNWADLLLAIIIALISPLFDLLFHPLREFVDL
jgi:hypothetical protein